MNRTNPKVDVFLSKEIKWQKEFETLRKIVLDCHLTEELKWGKPCYSFQKSNIVLIHGFKEYCALLFLKGVLLHDANGILIKQTENVQAGRQIRFTNVQEIVGMKTILKTAFNALTPGRQRAYILHFSAPKQSKTRQTRVEKCVPQILNGKGLDDQ
jgi:uncharacterized protein YdeI (YjbR/CyaY-like superfamily)